MKKENLIKDSKRIVIKIGSSLLIDKNKGNLKSEVPILITILFEFFIKFSFFILVILYGDQDIIFLV